MGRIIKWLKFWYHLKRRILGIALIFSKSEDRFKALWDQVNYMKANTVSHDQLKALQGIDQNWHDQGKIILMFHLKEKDIVKIIDVKSKTTMKDYIELSKSLEAKYGVGPKYYDGASMSRKGFFDTYWKGGF